MLKIIFWDVQHGSSAFVETPNGTRIAIDLGTGSLGSNTTFSPLLHLKNNGRVTQLDGVLITHPHRDHIDDIFNFDTLSPLTLLCPKHLTEVDIRIANQAKDNEVINKYLEISSRYNQPTINAYGIDTNPFRFENNGGVVWTTFTSTNCATTNLNNHSIVSVLSYANSKILIPGDNESASWKELLAMPLFRDAIIGTDILVASHHGRESGFHSDLFKHISPKLTIVSDGPAGTTSVTSKYQSQSSGWVVNNRTTNERKSRYCLTTRKDSVVVVKCGFNQDGTPYLRVDMG